MNRKRFPITKFLVNSFLIMCLTLTSLGISKIVKHNKTVKEQKENSTSVVYNNDDNATVLGEEHSSIIVENDNNVLTATSGDNEVVTVYEVENDSTLTTYIAEDNDNNKVVISVSSFNPVSEDSNPEDKDIFPPVLVAYDIVTNYGAEPDFSSVSAIDEKDGPVDFAVVGEYNIKKAGVYPLSVVARDDAGNSSTVNFLLTVLPHEKQKDLDNAIVVLNQTLTELSDARTKYNAAKDNYDTLVEKLEFIENKLLSNEEKINTLSNNKTAAENLLVEAKTKLELAQQTYEEALAMFADDGEITLTQAVLDSAKTRLEQAKKNYEDVLAKSYSQSELVAKTKADLEKSLQEEARLESLKKEKEAERSKLLEAREELVLHRNTAYNNYVTASEQFDAARIRYNEAVEKASVSDEFKKAKQNVENATVNLLSAINDENEARESLTVATSTLALLENEKAEQEKLLVERISAKNNADKAYENAVNNLESAKSVYTSTELSLEEKALAVENAQKEADEALAAKLLAENELEKAESVRNNTNERIVQATLAVENARASVNAVEDKINSGSLGFFKWHDSNTKAENILEDALATQGNGVDVNDNPLDEGSKTNLGAEGDATSLENMLATFTYLRECNELRADENAKALMVTDSMMAIEQIQVNYSKATINHSLIYNVGENLMWNYKDEDPFIYWYDIEKEVYDYKNEHPDASDKEIAVALGYPISYVQTGHYNNVRKDRYDITGFAINTVNERPYRFEFGQAFQYVSFTNDTLYTVDQYEADFVAYYTSLQNELAEAQTTLDEAEEYLSLVEASGGLTQDEIDSINLAKESLEEKKALLEEKTTILNNCIDDYNDALANYQEAKQSRDLAENEANLKLADKIDAENLVESTTQTLNEIDTSIQDTSDLIDSYNDLIDDAVMSQTDSQSEIEENNQIINSLASEVTDAASEVDEASSKLDEESKNLSDSDSLLDDVNDKLSDIENEIDDIKEEIDENQTDLSVISDNLSDAEKQLEETNNELSNANKEVGTLSYDVADLENTISALIQDVSDAENAVDEAKDKVDEVEKNVNDIQKELTELEDLSDDLTTEYIITSAEKDEADDLLEEAQDNLSDAETDYNNANIEVENLENEINGE